MKLRFAAMNNSPSPTWAPKGNALGRREGAPFATERPEADGFVRGDVGHKGGDPLIEPTAFAIEMASRLKQLDQDSRLRIVSPTFVFGRITVTAQEGWSTFLLCIFETSMMLRAWTHGWDATPNEYDRAYRDVSVLKALALFLFGRRRFGEYAARHDYGWLFIKCR